jgi:predicted metal-dependent peptidase
MMSKLTAEQRIERTHVQLMKHKNFCLFSGLFMVGKVAVDDETPTAKTNGVDVIYGRDFIGTLNDKQLAFLILHENMHKAYRHLVVWEKLHRLNHVLANAACDYVINLQIKDYDPQGDTVEMPTNAEGEVVGLIDEKYRGMDTAQVFKLLQEEYGNEGTGEGLGEGFDDHDWEGAKEFTDAEKEAVANEVEKALRQGAILAGKMNGNVSKEIGDLLTPKVDWKEALRDFVKTTTQGKDQTTWKRLHKRYISMDIVMPSSYDEKVGSILVGIDTSGSIGVQELSQFLSEVKSICEEVSPEKIDLLYWDTKVASHEVWQGHDLMGLTESTKPAGGGGTNPDCVPKFMKKEDIRPECVIMLTDGYIDSDKTSWNELVAPVMWCIKGNDRFSPDSVVGKVVHVE